MHLQKHVESTHSNHLQPDKQFCVDCSLLCSSKNELKTHGFQVHHRIYEYDCDLCEFTFVLSQARARHKLTCHDIKQNSAEDSTLNCEFCELTFMELRSLQSHKNIAHGQPLRKKSKLSNVEKVDGKYQCEFCLDLFSNNTSRVRHIEGKHEKVISNARVK